MGDDQIGEDSMKDMTKPFDVRSIGQDEFGIIKELTPEGVSFQGVNSTGGNSIQLDVGNYVNLDELSAVSGEVAEAFSDYGIPIETMGVQPDYRGATNQALFLVVKIENDEDWEPSGYGGISFANE